MLQKMKNMQKIINSHFQCLWQPSRDAAHFKSLGLQVQFKSIKHRARAHSVALESSPAVTDIDRTA